ncbi:hypothetical protein ADIARSV_4273 [Arcticibacter svalbardensis MN12-7]|uniref:Uncharacterized protein n=1 Tax=Arcticibacter svalbardensis MN12-7 TaxID=1150600 RepID=R9GLL1_9SPHI|nr:hypothetical protein ADIARSV_4273 [Arcticibacter svalbardensis MN12-7]
MHLALRQMWVYILNNFNNNRIKTFAQMEGVNYKELKTMI